MKLILIFLFVQLSTNGFSQTTNNLSKQSDMSFDSTTFVTKLNISNATKDGIYLNDYLVNIDYEKVKKLNGKNIKVSGKVTIIKGLKKMPKEYDEEGHKIIRQGRENDTKYIEFPLIEIIEK
jgi:hypothetical protein